jgi:hypothetical protein
MGLNEYELSIVILLREARVKQRLHARGFPKMEICMLESLPHAVNIEIL